MLSMERLEKEINNVIANEFDNAKLKRTLNEAFIKKGLNPKTITLLFDEKKTVTELNEFEKIAFLRSCKREFRNKIYDESNYFSSNVINSYENFIHPVREEIDIIKFRNFQEITPFEFYGQITFREFYELFNNNLLIYDMNIQREPSYRKLGNKYIKTATVDSSAVKSIENHILKGDFETTQVVFTLLTREDSTMKFLFEPKFQNIGDITIGSENPLAINDGFHRCLGIVNAIMKGLQRDGEYITGTISVKLVICDVARARRIMQQSFKRSSTNIEWLKSASDNDVNNFIDKLESESKYLKGNIAQTYEECVALKKRTYKSALSEIISKKSDINLTSKAEVLIKSKKMAEYIDTVIEMLGEEEILPSLYSIIVWYTEKMLTTGETIDNYNHIINRIKEIKDKDIKSMKLDKKTVNLNNVINFFEVKDNE